MQIDCEHEAERASANCTGRYGTENTTDAASVTAMVTMAIHSYAGGHCDIPPIRARWRRAAGGKQPDVKPFRGAREACGREQHERRSGQQRQEDAGHTERDAATAADKEDQAHLAPVVSAVARSRQAASSIGQFRRSARPVAINPARGALWHVLLDAPVAYGILPLFAFANAGVPLQGASLASLLRLTLRRGRLARESQPLPYFQIGIAPRGARPVVVPSRDARQRTS